MSFWALERGKGVTCVTTSGLQVERMAIIKPEGGDSPPVQEQQGALCSSNRRSGLEKADDDRPRGFSRPS